MAKTTVNAWDPYKKQGGGSCILFFLLLLNALLCSELVANFVYLLFGVEQVYSESLELYQ